MTGPPLPMQGPGQSSRPYFPSQPGGMVNGDGHSFQRPGIRHPVGQAPSRTEQYHPPIKVIYLICTIITMFVYNFNFKKKLKFEKKILFHYWSLFLTSKLSGIRQSIYQGPSKWPLLATLVVKGFRRQISR